MNAHATSSEVISDFAQTRISNQKVSEDRTHHANDSQVLSHDEEEADDQDLRSVAITFLSLGGLVLIVLTVIVWLIW